MKPRALRKGDTIGIISPSSGAAGLFPHRVERGRAALEGLGFRVVLAEHAMGRRGWVSGTPEERAADLHRMFADPSVKGILAAIGGDHSCQLLPRLDFDLIAANPKVFVGFSDVTVLNLAIHARTGLVTFNGPTLMTEFAEYPEAPAYSVEHFLKAVAAPAPIGEAVPTLAPIGDLAPAPALTDEFLDWRTKADLTRPRALQPSSGWAWLKPGRGEGPLLGGCIESMQHLRGTRYWPDFRGALLFLETSEDKPSPAWVDGVLADYENMGVLGSINGLVFGRPYGYSDDERAALHRVIVERTRAYSFPVLADVDF
ncbi:MAG: S66 family peptidase, partial [Bacillota bacterium]